MRRCLPSTKSSRPILDQADRFARKELYPLSERMDREEWWPDEAFRMIGDNGFFGATIPEEYGGAGLDLSGGRPGAAGLRTLEPCDGAVLAWRTTISAPTTSIATATKRSAAKISAGHLHGPEDRRAGPHRARRRLRRAGIDAHHRASATAIITSSTAARSTSPTDLSPTSSWSTPRPIAQKARTGISAFIVEKGFPGFKVAQKLTKMGYRGSQTAELVFEDCRVPAENLIGGEDQRRINRDERARP